jgi:alkaline phosphatase
LAALVNTLKKYPEITGNSGVKIVITGGRPQPADFKNYPSYLYFDGDLDKDYSADQLKNWNVQCRFTGTRKMERKRNSKR